MAQTPAARRRRGGGAEVPHREISTSAAIALAQASCRPPDRDRHKLEAGCRFAGTLRPGDTYWFPGNGFNPSYKGLARYTPCAVHPDVAHQHMHRVTVVWGPRLDTTSDIFGRDLIRYWIYDPATGNEGSATFGAYGQVRVEVDNQYWIPAPGTLDRAAEAALPHHPRCECVPCRPDLAVTHHPDCQCPTCEPGKWVPAGRAEQGRCKVTGSRAAVSGKAAAVFPGACLDMLACDIAGALRRFGYPVNVNLDRNRQDPRHNGHQ